MHEIKSSKNNDTFTRVISEKDESPTAEEAKKFVGGNVEIILSKNPETIEKFQVLANEKAKELKLSLNEVATQAAQVDVYGNAIMLLNDAVWE